MKKGAEVISTGNEHPVLSLPNKCMAMQSADNRLTCLLAFNFKTPQPERATDTAIQQMMSDADRICKNKKKERKQQNNTQEKNPNSTNIHITKSRLSKFQNSSLVLRLLPETD